jgi:aspartate/methionine/tyrosine aminotransferase
VFARRAGWDLARNPLSEAADSRRARGAPLVDLTEANPTHCGLHEGGAALSRALAERARDPASLRYDPDPRGPRAAREAIARHHARSGVPVGADQVVLTAGTSEGYAHLFRLLADPGDCVLVPRPGYPLFDLLAELEGVTTRGIPLRRGRGEFRLDEASLAAAAAARDARALLAIHPHNPTGHFVHPDDAALLRAHARRNRLALISDEVFADSGLPPAPGERRLPTLLCDDEDGPLHFVLSGASKLLALPQLKVSWIVAGGPRGLRDEAIARLETIADTYLSVSPLLAACLPALLESLPAVQAPLRARVAGNRARLSQLAAARAGCTLLPAQGGFSAILELESADGAPLDEEALALAGVERAGVLAHPGFFFDFEDDGRARLVLSLLPEPERFEPAAIALLDVVDAERAHATARAPRVL